jgi:DNA polymerase (family 10)
MSTNAELARIFYEIADLLDLIGESFKPEAYRRAARSIESLTEDIRAIAGRGQLDDIPGVGAAISEKTREFLRTGTIDYYERTRRAVPPGLLEIMRLPGIGPKTARRFWVELGVEGPLELGQALSAGRLTGVRGFGPKKIAQIQKALSERTGPAVRTSLTRAYATAERIVAALRAGAPVEQIEVAGSLRRRREDVGDIDILVTSSNAEAVFDAFSALPERREIRLRGGTKETILFGEGIQVDLRVLDPSSFGAALQYFTGSKDHNVHLRTLAKDQGLKINEYGVFRGEERIAGATEAEVYGALGLDWIPPEIRENHGEIEAAAAHAVPRLVAPEDLRGDLHLHLDEDAGLEAIPKLQERLARSSWEYAGVVLPPSVDPRAPAVVGLRALKRPKVLLGEEVGPEHLDAPRRPGVDFRILRADAAMAPRRDRGPATRSLLVGHWASPEGGGRASPEQVGPWVDWAVEHGLAIDVQPVEIAGGADSAAVRRVVDANGLLHVGTGRDPIAPGILAIGTARRGWAGPDHVLNSAAWKDLGVLTPTRRAAG